MTRKEKMRRRAEAERMAYTTLYLEAASLIRLVHRARGQVGRQPTPGFHNPFPVVGR